MKYALVTGGSRGIGRAVCLKLAASGYNILINYLNNETEALITLEKVTAYNVQAELLRFNVSSKAEVNEVLGRWIADHADTDLDVLVNNAGIRKDGLMLWMSDEQWDEVLSISLNGFFYVTQLVMNGMLVRRYGRVINVVSISGLKGTPGQTNYSAAKAGVIGATKALAQEVARRGVTVNAVAPGFIITDMTSDLNQQDFKKLIPMQRFGEPDEVADLIAFLASPQSSYITGEVISINGGLYS